MTTTYGSDFAGVDDIDALWSFETNEVTVLQQAIARRLICPPGALFYAPTYGYDIRSLVADVVDTDTAARSIDAEVRKDERVSAVSTTVTQIASGVLTIAITVTPANPALAPFTLTLNVTSVTVELLGSV
jgi:hypothetical protein